MARPAEQKHRVLLACKNRVHGGGQEKQYIEVARRFAGRYRLTFLMAGGHVEPDMAGLGRMYRFPGRGRKLFAPLDMFYMAYVILRERIELVHAHHRYPAFLGSLLRYVLPVRQLTTVHNVFPDKSAVSLWGDRLIAVSQGVADWLSRRCRQDSSRITVIHNGISPPPAWTPEALAALRAEFGLAAGDRLLCSVGRLSRQKNYGALFRILARMQVRDWTLLLVGDGEERDRLEQEARHLGLAERVRFLGHRDDVEGIMQLADIYVMSSSWEGLPYALVEALANGLPAVVTDVGGVAEAITDGVTGYVVRAGDEDMFTQRLAALLDDPALRETMSANGKERFGQFFLDEVMFDRIEQEYRRLLG